MTLSSKHLSRAVEAKKPQCGVEGGGRAWGPRADGAGGDDSEPVLGENGVAWSNGKVSTGQICKPQLPPSLAL